MKIPAVNTHQPPIIKILNLSKIFSGQIAVNQVDLNIYPGEFFSILGGSGSGKTTLLRMLGGFETPTSGKIFLDGQDMENVPPYSRPINTMFQSYALFPHMNVWQNIAFGLKQDRLSKDEVQTRTEAVLKLVQMEKYAKRKPQQLSGGQQQRVALARCLAKQPKVLLLDEPLSALDKKLREQMQFELVDIQEKTKITFVMVTHDQAEAMTMSTRIGIMNNGSLEQIGAPSEVYEYPQNRFTAEFIGTTNTFTCKVAMFGDHDMVVLSEEADCQFWVDRALDVSEGQTLWCAVRPEKIEVSKRPPDDYNPAKPRNCLKGVVADIAYLGGVSTYHVKLPNGKVIKATDFNVERDAEHPTWEDTVYLSWDPASIMVLTS